MIFGELCEPSHVTCGCGRVKVFCVLPQLSLVYESYPFHLLARNGYLLPRISACMHDIFYFRFAASLFFVYLLCLLLVRSIPCFYLV